MFWLSSRFLSVSALFALMVSPSLNAATLIWDAVGNVQGGSDGSGNWDSAVSQQWYNATTQTSVSWPTVAGYSAQFGASASSSGAHTVSVEGNHLVERLIFAALGSDAYTLTGSATTGLQFKGTDAGVDLRNANATVQTRLSGTDAVTIRSTVAENRLTLSGTLSNAYSGTVTIENGDLYMAKTGGAKALMGDVILNGGSLRWGAAHQLAETSSVTLNAGTLWLNNQTQILQNLSFLGGANNGGGGSNGGTLIVNGTLTVGANGGSINMNSGVQWTGYRVVLQGPATGGATTAMTLTGNSKTNLSKLTVGSGGLVMNNRNVVLNTGASDTGGQAVAGVLGSRLILNGNVTSTGNASILKNGTNVGTAVVDLGSAMRTWDAVSDAAGIAVSITGTASGGLKKKGEGSLALTGDNANIYEGLTVVEAGILRLGKTSGINAIAGAIEITGGRLRWDQNHQLADTVSIVLNGGFMDVGNYAEKLHSITQNSGGINFNGNTNGGLFELTGKLQLTGGNAFVLNSAASWSVYEFEATSTYRATAMSFNGNSSALLNRVTIGEGGLKLNGHTIALTKAIAATAYGSELTLNGNFVGTANNNFTASNPEGYGVAQVNLNGGQRRFDVQSGTTSITANVVSRTATLTGTGAVDTLGGITKQGTGILVLGGTNTYQGETRIEAGTLRLSSTGSVGASSLVSVKQGATFDVGALTAGWTMQAGQTLEGNGQVTGSVVVSSGSALKTGIEGESKSQKLQISQSLTLKSGSTTTLQLTNDGAHDQLAVLGNLTIELGAKVNVQWADMEAFYGATFDLFDFASLTHNTSNFGDLLRDGASDALNDFDLPDLASAGLLWDLSSFHLNGRISVVPEPSKCLMFMAGVLSLILRRRRQERFRRDG